jgi:predicted nucleic acid-binding protein
VIYIDSSVALARLFFEARSPPLSFWTEPTVSSRLLEYEVWNRVHAYGRTDSHAAETTALLAGVELVDMEQPILARALRPLPTPLRTLDALHLATMHYLRTSGEHVEFASYDSRLVSAAQTLGIAIAAL